MPSDAGNSILWEYTIVHTDRLNAPGGPQLAPMWRRQYADGSTDWDQINKLGADGWEMISAFPVEAGGTLQYVAFVFKRPRRPGSPTAGTPSQTDAVAEPPAAPPTSTEETPTDGA
jgi:hypothetical protein